MLTNAEQRYLSRSWQTDDGLPHNWITAIHQARDGYLWLATREGLARFDGVRFTVMDTLLLPDVRNRHFVSICEDNGGTLWVANEDGKVWQIQSNKVSDVRIPGDVAIGRLVHTSDDSVWMIALDHGVFQNHKGALTHFGANEGLTNLSDRSICEDQMGNIWIATAAGISRWKDGQITTYTTQNGLLNNMTRVVYADRDNNIWVASHFGLTRWKDGKGLHFTSREGLSENLITAILEDRAGTIWLGTINGLNRFENGRIQPEFRPDGLSYGGINCLFEDREENLWIGTREGLTRLRSRNVAVYSQQQGLTHNIVTSVLADQANNLWVGFWGGGVNRIHDNQIAPYTRQDGLSSDLVLTMHESRTGQFWLGMDYDGGMNLRSNDKFVHYREREGMTDQAVKVFQDDRENNLWIGTRTGLLRFKDGKFQRFTRRDGLPSDTIEAIHEDGYGRLWFGTGGGLAVRQHEAFQVFTTKQGLSHNSITAIYEDKKGSLWLGTRGGGLNRLVVMNRTNASPLTAEPPLQMAVTSFTTGDGLCYDTIFSVIEDDLGFIWMSSPQGIFRIEKADLENFVPGGENQLSCISFGKSEGMLSVECKGTDKTAVCKTSDGRLWFPTSKGLVVINPREVKINARPPLIAIEEITADKKMARVAGVESPSQIEIAPGKGELEIHYTALSLAVPEKVRFKYKLEGVDATWMNVGTRRVAYYNNIRPGNYRFLVNACNNDGLWNEVPATISFIVMPHYWQTHWFIGAVAIVSVLFVAGTTRFVTWKRVQRRLEHLEQQHAIQRERTRIAQDIHDDIGATLTQIAVLSQLAEKESHRPEQVRNHAGKITATARELTQSMDEIVWAINPKNDTVRHLIGYIFRFSEEFLSLTEVQLRKERPSVIPDLSVSAEVRHNVLLVIKEAMNNIVRHSGASEVRLAVKLTATELLVQIEDNGHGFPERASDPYGNGLDNMKKRVDDIGGCFEMKSAPQGTCLRLVVPLPNPA